MKSEDNFSIRKMEYQKLELDVKYDLIDRILNNGTESKFYDGLCIPVNIYDYVELGIFNGDLTFFDRNGYHYSLYSECTLEDLIDILDNLL